MSTPRYIAASMRLSFKDHGRHGQAWAVVDRERGVRVCRADDKSVAEAEAARLNGAVVGGPAPEAPPYTPPFIDQTVDLAESSFDFARHHARPTKAPGGE